MSNIRYKINLKRLFLTRQEWTEKEKDFINNMFINGQRDSPVEVEIEINQ